MIMPHVIQSVKSDDFGVLWVGEAGIFRRFKKEDLRN